MYSTISIVLINFFIISCSQLTTSEGILDKRANYNRPSFPMFYNLKNGKRRPAKLKIWIAGRKINPSVYFNGGYIWVNNQDY